MQKLVIKQDLNKIIINLVHLLILLVLFILVGYFSFVSLVGITRTITVAICIVGGLLALGSSVNILIRLPKLKKAQTPIATLSQEGIDFNYTQNLNPLDININRMFIPWEDIVDTGLYKYGAANFITITLVDPKGFFIGLSEHDKQVAVHYRKLCGTPVAFSLSSSELSAEAIIKEVNFYHSSARQL